LTSDTHLMIEGVGFHSPASTMVEVVDGESIIVPLPPCGRVRWLRLRQHACQALQVDSRSARRRRPYGRARDQPDSTGPIGTVTFGESETVPARCQPGPKDALS